MRLRLLTALLSPLVFLASLSSAFADPIKIGVQTALTGDAAAFGQDIKNALTLANEELGGGKYELLFEDERCVNKDAASVAHKLIDIDKVKYVLGFPCNGTLFATAPIYEKAGVLVITSSATSGDVLELGKHIFRLFPSDAGCSAALQQYVAKHNKKIAILTEQNEYPVMMDRTFRRYNAESKSALQIETFEFTPADTDFRTIASKIRARGFDAIFLNANTESSFISLVKQMDDLKLAVDFYTAYLPASESVREALGDKLEGYRYCNLPVSSALVTAKGKPFFEKFKARFGEPKSGFPVVPVALESFRLLDQALTSKIDPLMYLVNRSTDDGFIPPYRLDVHGAIQGIQFEMQRIEAGQVKVIQ